MTKEEIQKNSEHWYNKYKDAAKRIAELEAYNEKLLDCDIEKHNKIVELEAQIKEMKGILLCTCEGCSRLPKLYKSFDKEIKEK